MKKIFQLLSTLLLTTLLGSAQATEGYIAVERHSKRVLLAANTEQPVALGKFSQLATVKVALDWSKASNTSLATVVVVPHGVNVGFNPLSLQPGDKVTLRDMIYSISMANDDVSALVVADFVGRKILSHRRQTGSSVGSFVAEMNTLAAHLKMTRTIFISPVGGATETTTVSDLAKLTVGMVNTHGFEFYSKQKSRRLTLTRVNGTSQTLTVVNNNKLIGQLGVSGVKAIGANSAISADKASYKQNLASGQIKVTPVQLVVISVNSSNRDARVKQLISTGWKQYETWRASGYQISAGRKEFLQ